MTDTSMTIDDFYADLVEDRVGILHPGEPLPPEQYAAILARCVDRLVAIVAAVESQGVDDGLSADLATLRGVAARWTLLADSFDLVVRRQGDH